MNFGNLRVALVHDWLITVRGGERVLDALCELFPQAVVHTLVRVPGGGTPRIEAMQHAPSWADKLPFVHHNHRFGLPFYLLAVEGWDLAHFDLVVSSSHLCAKAAIAGPGAVHVCYCHTPVRYAWDRLDDYVAGGSALLKPLRPLIDRAAAHLRAWDAKTAPRVDRFVANSAYVANKIQRFYGRAADVVHPPVDCAPFLQEPPGAKDHDLVLGALVPYKRVDLALEAYRTMPERTLWVAGDGPERARLQAHAPPNVRFLGRVPESDLAGLYAGAKYLIFPGEEDAGIVPLEAQAAGTPVIALGKGGALETVRHGETGYLYSSATAAGLADAIRAADSVGFAAPACRTWAERFDRAQFLAQMAAQCERALAEKRR
jgi:glycosyltransferase involved in cell wall biosynthesis